MDVLCPDHSLLVPSPKVDLRKWCVVACDQFTSQPDYWDEAEQIVGGAPSTLRLVYPELYLSEPESSKASRISSIHSTMREYLASGVLVPAEWPILVERTTLGRVRCGLVVAVDLEAYQHGRLASSCAIRPTEEVVVDRLPSRILVRRGAPLEVPHVLLLLDDPKCSVVEPLAARARDGALGAPAYDTDLMLGGGHVRGWCVAGEDRRRAMEAIAALASREAQVEKYGDKAPKVPLLFAVGDGNHSLASAKAVWEDQKKAGASIENSPGRYALVELCNIHDPALVFEPIHRVIVGADPAAVLRVLRAELGERFSFERVDDSSKIVERVRSHGNALPHLVGFLSPLARGLISIQAAAPSDLSSSGCRRPLLAVVAVQPVLDSLVEAGAGGIEIDYIHGDDVVCEVGKHPAHCAFVLPSISKSDLFTTVVSSGVVPRKTFSMGHAEEKRYYLEARCIL